MIQQTNEVERHPLDATRRFRTSRAAMVAVTLNHGIALPRSVNLPAMPLDRTGLEVLTRLSREAAVASDAADAIAADLGLERDAVLLVIAHLVDHHALIGDDEYDIDGPSVASPDPGPVELQGAGPIDADERQVLTVPTVFRIHEGAFEHRHHDGRLVLSLDPSGLVAAAAWREPSAPEAAYSRFVSESGSNPRDREWFDDMSARLRAADMLQPFDPERPANGNRTVNATETREAVQRYMRILHATDLAVEKHKAEAVESPASTDRVPVIPIHNNWVISPLSLGMIVAYAKAHDDGALQRHYDFVPRWLVQATEVTNISDRPSIFLLSNYIWNSGANLDTSARLKEKSPTSVTVHGGPDTPKYEADVQRFFRDNPHVDVAVRGEGEMTFAAMLEALAGQVGDGPADLSPLGDVPGLSFRLGDRVITTPDRDRMADLDAIPSPYLTGLFDSYAAGPARAAMIESNRGCPYGCTFCDWGSATNSRIRKFDLDRVFAEIEWCAKRGFEVISLCDANFGIFERDVAIAEKFAEVKQKYGFPLTVGNNYAKNTVKHLKEIIRIFADAGIVAEGVISLQSMDADTLQVIRRKNIKVEKYTDLAGQFVENRLPLAVDIMMALPGSSVESLKGDLQNCANRDVRTRVHPTSMLTNSPMNEPEYRAEHGLVALPGELVKQSKTFDEDDWQFMWELRNVYLLCDLFAILRQVARYVRSETELQEVAFYERLMCDVAAQPERWPTIAFTFRSMANVMVPPCSWKLFTDEIHDYLTTVLGVPDDSALETVISAQLLLLPGRDRRFPETITTAHDITAWHRARIAAYEAGHLDDWEKVIPPLRSFGPATLTVDDPEDICTTGVGGDLTTFSMHLMAWDLESPIARPRNTQHDEPATPTRADHDHDHDHDHADEGLGSTPVALSIRPTSDDRSPSSA